MRRNAYIIAIALCALLIAGCQNPPPIGGDVDDHGCLIAAGYSWDTEVGACARSWELDQEAKKAAGMAVAHLSYPVTVTAVQSFGCEGCYKITLQRNDNRETQSVVLENWIVKECGPCALYSPPAPGYCENGTIVPGDPDPCGCPVPPHCVMACTMDAKICPDGSAVGRDGANNCEFTPCPGETGIANPASVYCEEQGGTLEMRDGDDGQFGMCILPDGTECEEWSYLNGECPQRQYVDRNPEKCALVKFMCVSGRVPFFDETGCGCELQDTGKLKATDCLPEERDKPCTREYIPVCGWFGPDIQCVKYPCAATYGNKCSACSDSKVISWTEGGCPE